MPRGIRKEKELDLTLIYKSKIDYNKKEIYNTNMRKIIAIFKALILTFGPHVPTYIVTFPYLSIVVFILLTFLGVIPISSGFPSGLYSIHTILAVAMVIGMFVCVALMGLKLSNTELSTPIYSNKVYFEHRWLEVNKYADGTVTVNNPGTAGTATLLSYFFIELWSSSIAVWFLSIKHILFILFSTEYTERFYNQNLKWVGNSIKESLNPKELFTNVWSGLLIYSSVVILSLRVAEVIYTHNSCNPQNDIIMKAVGYEKIYDSYDGEGGKITFSILNKNKNAELFSFSGKMICYKNNEQAFTLDTKVNMITKPLKCGEQMLHATEFYWGFTDEEMTDGTRDYYTSIDFDNLSITYNVDNVKFNKFSFSNFSYVYNLK